MPHRDRDDWDLRPSECREAFWSVLECAGSRRFGSNPARRSEASLRSFATPSTSDPKRRGAPHLYVPLGRSFAFAEYRGHGWSGGDVGREDSQRRNPCRLCGNAPRGSCRQTRCPSGKAVAVRIGAAGGGLGLFGIWCETKWRRMDEDHARSAAGPAHRRGGRLRRAMRGGDLGAPRRLPSILPPGRLTRSGPTRGRTRWEDSASPARRGSSRGCRRRRGRGTICGRRARRTRARGRCWSRRGHRRRPP